MLADMRDDNGGFYATRDADSEGHEGLYYLWDPNEVRNCLATTTRSLHGVLA